MENEKKKPFVFEMTDVESECARAFMQKHYQCLSRVEERFAVTFLPTGTGDMVFIRCLACGEQEELTEIEKF